MNDMVNKSSLVSLILKFLNVMSHPDCVCRVETELNHSGDVILIVILDRKFFITSSFIRSATYENNNMDELRDYYVNKVYNYFGVRLTLFFMIGTP